LQKQKLNGKFTGTNVSTWNAVNSGVIESVITTKALTVEDSGKTFVLNLAGGFTVTLPALADAAGFKCKFVVGIAPTTAYIVSAGAAPNTDSISGPILNRAGVAGVAIALGDQVNFVASQAIIGDYINIESDGSAWFVDGVADVVAGITATG
jgi:hypothetical protein